MYPTAGASASGGGGGGAGGPTFSRYKSAPQAITSGSAVLLTFDTSEFDTSSDWDATNNRFQPSLAGYYLFIANCVLDSADTLPSVLFLYKNGAAHKRGTQSGASSTFGFHTSALIHMNGSTDYVDARIFLGSNHSASAGVDTTFFQGTWIRPT